MHHHLTARTLVGTCTTEDRQREPAGVRELDAAHIDLSALQGQAGVKLVGLAAGQDDRDDAGADALACLLHGLAQDDLVAGRRVGLPGCVTNVEVPPWTCRRSTPPVADADPAEITTAAAATAASPTSVTYLPLCFMVSPFLRWTSEPVPTARPDQPPPAKSF
jgi:hypothetical protein